MSVKLNILKNAGASIWVKVSIIVFRFIQVPLLIAALGVDNFGRWLVLSSLPSWLMLANLGFGSVASNDMSMLVAKEDLKNARITYSTSLALVMMIGIIGTLLILLIIPFLPVESFLHLPVERHNEIVMAIIWFSLTVFLSFFDEIFHGKFRAARKAHIATVIYSFLPWLDLLAIVITLRYSVRFDHIALGLLCSNALYLLIVKWISSRTMPDLTFSFNLVRLSNFKFLFQKGLAFLAFPIGNALLYQGNLFIVQAILGPATVALFGTVRTLTRTVNQVMEITLQITWPEFSHLLGAKDYNRAAKLHSLSVAVSIILSLLGVIALAIGGHFLYEFWTGKSIDLPQHLLLIFLLPIPFNTLWFASSVIHVSSNQHEKLAKRYLIATVLSAILCIVLSKLFGIEGAAVSPLIIDIILIPFVIKYSLFLTHDTLPNFINRMFTEIKTIPALVKSKATNPQKQ